MNWLCFGLFSLLLVYAYGVEPPDENPGKFGRQFEGDMLFTNSSGVQSGSHAFRANDKWIWPDGNVYYRLAPTIKNDAARASMIRDAMNEITKDAPCVHFIDVEQAGVNAFAFVDIVTYGDFELKVSGLGCHSEVGYQGRRQILNLQPDECFHSATIKHELFHTLGSVHENSRPDVAEALEILVENIHPDMRKNFKVEKYDDEDVDKGVYDYKTPYDIMSIMQYPAHAFAFNDSLKTMKSKDPAFEGSFGYSEDFSAIDIVELNLRYNCTLSTPLVFDYVNEYFDIIISRRRMDRYAIAKLEEKIEIYQDEIDKLKVENEKLKNQSEIYYDEIEELKRQSELDKNEIAALKDQKKADQDRFTKIENLIGKMNAHLPTEECKRENLQRSGIAFVKVGAAEIPIWCIIPKEEGPAWIVIQKRGQFGNDPNMFSDKMWSDYKNYFGDPKKEYWIGLENMNKFTSNGHWILDVELTNWENDTYNALYSSFKVMEGSTNYQLRLGSFQDQNSTLGDSLFILGNEMYFTTRDRDNDRHDGYNCATSSGSHGGWWYSACSYSSLNGVNSKSAGSKGIRWCEGANKKSACNENWAASLMKIRKM